MTKQIASLFLAAVATVAGIFPSTDISYSMAASEDKVPAIESSYVLDDLQGSTIEGKAFNLADYPYDEDGELRLLSFSEYCYTSKTSQNYGLYVYVYNPQGLTFDVSSEKSVMNEIEFSVCNQSVKEYKLSFLSCSADKTLGLFYKFKVVLTDEDKKEIYSSFSGERVYNINAIELMKEGDYFNPESYTIGKQYKFSGNVYDGTLSCTTSGVDVLELDVGHTYYRPDGTNGKSQYSQDSLHSVWFAVPKDKTGENGEMTAIHASWRDARLKPQLVTGNADAVKYTKPLLGKNIGSFSKKAGYGYISTDNYLLTDVHQYVGSYSYNMIHDNGVNKQFNDLYFIYESPVKLDSADEYIISSDLIEENIRKSAELYGGELIDGKYSKKIFSSIASEKTDLTIRAEDTFKLTQQNIKEIKSWGDFWERLFGGGTTTLNYEMQAIKKLEDLDFQGLDLSDKKTVKKVCDKLYVSTADFDALYDDYTSLKETHDIYLFRYQKTNYVAAEMVEYWIDQPWWIAWFDGWQSWRVDTNAYMFADTINLGFDILEIEITNDKAATMIPVSMDPVDIVHDGTPPVNTTSDKKDIPLWLIILGTIVLILLIAKIVAWVRIVFPKRPVVKVYTGDKKSLRKRKK